MDEQKLIHDPPQTVLALYQAVIEFINEGCDINTLKVADITGRAGIGKGTAYEYFSSKEEIISSAILYYVKVCFEKLQVISTDNRTFQQKINEVMDFIDEHVKDYQTVLELGCGTGEIAIRLAHLGKQVCATDISKDMLEVAKYKCIDFKADVMLSRIDMCDFAVDSQLDLILCLCDSLNYVIDLKNVKQAFENTYNALKKGGSFIFDIDSMYKMETILKD